jgi:hypothetical protein
MGRSTAAEPQSALGTLSRCALTRPGLAAWRSMRWRRPSRPSVDAVAVETFGWAQSDVREHQRVWRTHDGMLSVEYFDVPPDLPPRAGGDQALRDFFEAMVRDNESMVLMNAGWIDLRGFDAVESMFKVSLTDRRGLLYGGSFILPVERHSWVVKLQFVEGGITGSREALALSVQLSSGGELADWCDVETVVDADSGTMRQRPTRLTVLPSDDSRWDEMLPDHPLSKLRRGMAAIAETIEIDAAIRQQRPFR